ncbi:hypothetical protein GMDG_02077 [Pseudogymnoascus destructans 20631-21]|uniref:Uncharacterized protein n=1 Tax=Pseudogymnoascus destructans (strain ATCC MYA-4855 / 20631-21) TaxID=658429 RepID=L8G0N7_PSED2|nr:hypothetical protein GMDG_02077 [Pseudogymnoascus destructans 20631-21]
MRNLDIDYNIASFFRDLGKIRQETFKKGTIIGAFREAGMWPINPKEALKKMKVYTLSEKALDLPQIPQTPTKFVHSELKLQHWQAKIPYLFSSPSAREWDSWARGTENVLAQGELAVLQYDLLSTKVANQQKAKVKSRNVVQATCGPLTAKDSWKKIADKAKKEKETQERKSKFRARIALNKVKKELRIRGVEARKAELLRKRQVTQLLKAKQEVPPDLLNPIPDPEKIAQESEIQEEANIQLISTIGWSGSQVDDDDETGFIRFSGLDEDIFTDRTEENLDSGLF